MMDGRQAVAEEFVGELCSRAFIRPRGWTDEQADSHVSDLISTARRNLPRDRANALEACRRARAVLVERAKTKAWPVASEIANALKDASKRDASSGSEWPHQNSEYVIESTARWLERFGEWPEYLLHAHRVAEALIGRGEFTEDALIDAGYRKDGRQ